MYDELCKSTVESGEVIQVDDDSILILFEIDGELIERTYLKTMFMEGKVPQLHDKVIIHNSFIRVPYIEEYKPKKPREFKSGPVEF
jgi:hypothetical protein